MLFVFFFYLVTHAQCNVSRWKLDVLWGYTERKHAMPCFAFLYFPDSHQITQTELNEGRMSYTASATGMAVNGEPVSASSTWTETLVQDPAIEIGQIPLMLYWSRVAWCSVCESAEEVKARCEH